MYSLQSTQYWVQIRLKGALGSDWSDYFGPLELAWECREDHAEVSILSGSVADQSALIGMLNSLHGLSLNLLSVQCTSSQDPSLVSQARVSPPQAITAGPLSENDRR